MSTRSYVNVAHGPRSLFLKSSGAAWYVCFQLLSRAHFWCKCLGSRARGERTCQSHRRKWGYRKNTNTQTTRAITALIYHFPLKTHITSMLDDCSTIWKQPSRSHLSIMKRREKSMVKAQHTLEKMLKLWGTIMQNIDLFWWQIILCDLLHIPYATKTVNNWCIHWKKMPTLIKSKALNVIPSDFRYKHECNLYSIDHNAV